MKKISIILSLVILIICLFIPISKEETYTINGNFLNAVNQLNIAQSWKNWYKPLDDSTFNRIDIKEDFKNKVFYLHQNKKMYEIHKFSPSVIQLRFKSPFLVIVNIAIGYQSKNEIIINEKITQNTFSYFLHLITKKNKEISIAKSLKEFLENPDQLYGFKIRDTQVPDTAFMMLTKNVLQSHKLVESKKLLLKGILLAKKTHTKVISKVYLSEVNLYNDSAQLSVLLPVKSNERISNESYFLEMPKNGKMLYLHYQGPYNKAILGYNALINYANDKKLNNIFSPFERFNNHKIPNNMTDTVDLNIYYPYF